jgi:sarcosine oxidase
MNDTEFVVVGAGLLGLATARALARRGRQALVLDAGTVGNDHAGSKGSARIFRFGYDDPFYVSLAMATEPLWRELESESGDRLLDQTGQVTFGPDLPLLIDAMRSCGAPCQAITPAEVKDRFPGLAAADAVLEPASGVLFADRCLQALRSAVDVALRENVTVSAVTEAASGVVVRAGEETFTADVAIICAGGRSTTVAGLDPSLQRSTLEQVAYLAPPTDDLPIVIDRSDPLLYGLPNGDGSYKIGLHHAGETVDPATARMEADPPALQALAEATRRVIPGWSGEVVRTERCLYDNSPNEDFILDRRGRIVIGCGTSGHGFKFGPYLGERLADLATGTPLADELARFRLR